MPGSRVEELRRRLEKDPGSRLFAQLAEEHRKAGEHGEAIRVARAGLAHHPVYPSARLTLGRALLESGDAAGARAELEEALRQAPDNILASRFLGQTLEALGDRSGAVRQYQAMLRMAPLDQDLAAHIRELSAPPPLVAPPPLSRPSPERTRAVAEAATHPMPVGVPEAPPADAPREEALAATVRLPAGPAPAVPLPPAEARPPQAPAAAEAGGGAAPFSSSTLAELYLRQGLHEQALDMYRRVVARDPANERARKRLVEIEAGTAGATPAEAAGQPAAEPDRTQAHRRAIERAIADLEALLEAIRRRQ